MQPVRARWLVWVFACVVLSGPLAPAASAQFDIIAQSGDASPDGNGTLLTFTSPALGDAGHVSFLSMLVGTSGGVSDNRALFRASEPGTVVVLRRGDAINAMETAGDFVSSLPAVNSAGTVSHTVLAEGSSEEVSFLGEGGPLTLLPRYSTPSPEHDNQLSNRSIPVLNNLGVTAYAASYGGAQPETGVYSWSADGTFTTRLLAGTGAPAGGTILSLGTSLPTINDASQIALIASVDDGVFTRKTVLRLDGTAAVELARDGDMTVDEMTAIGNILPNSVPLNEVGQVAFSATYTQMGVSQRQGIFRADGDGATLLAANPLPESANLATNMRVHGLSDSGEVAFSTDLSSGVDPTSAIYTAGDGGANLIALEDEPTMPGGDQFFRSFDVRSISINTSGQMAFLAELSDTADGPFSGRGLYFYDPVGGLQEVIRSGDMLAGETIASLGLTGQNQTLNQPLNEMQAPDLNFSGLNNEGHVAFSFSLSSGVAGVAIWSNSVEVVPGDYNGNGVVDAADYTVWRDHLGQSFTLSGEDPGAMTPGEVDQEDYDFWVSRFGATSGGASGAGAVSASQAAVPEPASAGLLLTAWLVASAFGGARRR